MLPRYRSSLAIFALLVGFIATPIHSSANAAEEASCRKVLEKPLSGQSAIDQLGSEIGYVASINRRTPTQLKDLLLSSREFHIDICGRAFFADSTFIANELPLPNALEVLPTTLVTGNGIGARPLIDPNQVFKLHSNPKSKKIMYLNFKGRDISGTAWNANYNNNQPWFAKGFSQDDKFNEYTKTELEIIQSVWQRVAEDFVAFDVDVTTEAPSDAELDRTNAADTEYGTEIVISADSVIFNSCKCSGLAYLGSFDMIGPDHAANQPAWVFTRGVGDNPKYIAESITHELGHTVGLSHDGTASSPYFSGNSGWAPIMGVGFYQPVTQWSKGEYPSANNNEDEYEVMENHGLKLRTDEDKNSFESARNLNFGQKLGGVIGTPSDQDFFVFSVPSNGEFTLNALPATFSPNLDIDLSIYENPSTKLAQSNPPIKVVNNDVADGMSAFITLKLTANKKYYAVLTGTPVSTDGKNSRYGSIGTYQISLDLKSVVQLSVLPVTQSNLQNSDQYSSNADISDKLITPVASDDPQKLILPNGITSVMIYKIKKSEWRAMMIAI